MGEKTSRILGLLGAIFVVLFVIWYFWPQAGQNPSNQQTAEETAPAEQTVAAAPVVVTTEPKVSEAPTELPRPVFDLVRAEADGSILVAGSAPSASKIAVLMDRQEAVSGVPDGNGQFALMFNRDPSELGQAAELLLEATIGDQKVLSESSAILTPMTVAEAPAPEQSQEPEASAETQEAQAPAVILAGKESVSVLQPAQSPAVMSEVSLDAISYSDDGDVSLAGRAPNAGFVRVYVDNTPVTTSKISDGNWQAKLPQIDSGVYNLRVDNVDQDGTVVSRVETPFKREEQANIAAAAGVVQAVTVQPGSTLWAIARERYGDGVLYVRVFEANKDRIRNPDLIYPGQVFTLPTE